MNNKELTKKIVELENYLKNHIKISKKQSENLLKHSTLSKNQSEILKKHVELTHNDFKDNSEILKKHVELTDKDYKSLSSIAVMLNNTIIKIMKVISVIIFILNLIIIYILYPYISKILNSTQNSRNNLTEWWQIAIFTIIWTLFAWIIATVLWMIIYEKVKSK